MGFTKLCGKRIITRQIIVSSSYRQRDTINDVIQIETETILTVHQQIIDFNEYYM